MFGCQARGLKQVTKSQQCNRNLCGHFLLLSTLRMLDSSRNFAEIVKDAYESYLVLNV